MRKKLAVLRNPPTEETAGRPGGSIRQFVTMVPEVPFKFGLLRSHETKQLLAMDRYERRALSLRNLPSFG